ncbi:MAG: DUF378 domain-containing protein [Candidatus Niyogibacteria bacterium]|nr:DUF378 domain-containing protein [Candidatus Niyogibacteria bacterium]
MKWVHIIAFTLVIIGGLNWGLTALGWNVVNLIVGSWPIVEKLVYLLVGLSAIWLVVMHKKDCKMCGMMGGGMGMGGMKMGGM